MNSPTFRPIRGLLVGIVVLILVILALLNVGGWRARVFAFLLRTNNKPNVVAPPPDFLPHVPAGFHVSIFAKGFKEPRWLAIAPNGDVFVADSATGEVIVVKPEDARTGIKSRWVFANNLNLPFGIAFHDDYVYVANTDEVVRFRYDRKTSARLGNAEHVLSLPGEGYHQHWTRTLTFSPDGKTLFVSVGSESNVSIESDPRRAAILAMNPDGTNMRVYASGLRNAVGIGFDPSTSNGLWATVNERDNIGDDVPSDYFTHVIDGGFYGWPYSYLGNHVDNRVSPRPDLVAKAIVPDLLLGAHVAPLQFAFYDKRQFPASYWNGVFIAEHGSWNRNVRSGYQVVFLPFQDGLPNGTPIPFLTGFVPDVKGKNVYGRVVGVAVAVDGSLLISDDGESLIWQVTYQPDRH